MRGLRLYIRPIEAADQPGLEAFFARTTPLAPPGAGGAGPDAPVGRDAVPAWGLLGKLIGDIVAVAALEITDDGVRIDDLVVAPELRRKWIGRAMMREIEQLAVRLERRRIVVEDAGEAQEFFRRVGFESEGERWIRNL